MLFPGVPNHCAKSVCAERLVHVIGEGGEISSSYSGLINSQFRCRIMMSYWLQECYSQREANTLSEWLAPFPGSEFSERIPLHSPAAGSSLVSVQPTSPLHASERAIQTKAPHLSLFAKCAAGSICKDKGKLLCQQVLELR